VEVSEKLARIFRQNGLSHTVLNAKQHDREAEIITQAGQKGAITISTNMAGRGTDIKLGPDVAELGGLHVIGTTRHQSRRIDRQLRGRCARQGDPGTSVFFVSFEDELMRLFASPRLNAMLMKLRPPEGEAISSPLLTRSIEVAQKRVEQRNYSYRKHTLEYDDVMNKHRQEIYAFRNEILHAKGISETCDDVLSEVLERKAAVYFQDPMQENGWDEEGYRNWLMSFFPVRFSEKAFESMQDLSAIVDFAYQRVSKAFHDKFEQEKRKILIIEETRHEGHLPEDADERASDAIVATIKRMLIYKMDRLWQEHLLTMDHLRTEVGLRTVAQKDPLLEFKHEAFESFSRLNEELYEAMAKDLFSFSVMPQDPGFLQELMSQLKLEKDRSLVEDLEAGSDSEEDVQPDPVSTEDRAGRNEPCPCGSGKKYKKCCGLAQIQAE
jgi:preprotein translocase subunit SecA